MATFDELVEITGKREHEVVVCLGKIGKVIPGFNKNQVSYNAIIDNAKLTGQVQSALNRVGDGLAADFRLTISQLGPLVEQYSLLQTQFLDSLTAMKTHPEVGARWGKGGGHLAKLSLGSTLRSLEVAYQDQDKFRGILQGLPEFSTAFINARRDALKVYDRWLNDLAYGAQLLRRYLS